MASISLEAFDGTLKGKLSMWILPSQESCALPNGFQDQVLSGVTYQTQILLITKQESKAWFLSHSWDMTFVPETTTDWSLLLSIVQHLKKPVLIVTTPKCVAPQAFWQKCQAMQQNAPTCVQLKDLYNSTISVSQNSTLVSVLPSFIFFPKLDSISDTEFMKIPSSLPSAVQQSIQTLDLRTLYRELRGAGASLCLSLTVDSRLTNGSVPFFSTTWFYPESNGALRLHVSELRSVLRTVTDRLAD